MGSSTVIYTDTVTDSRHHSAGTSSDTDAVTCTATTGDSFTNVRDSILYCTKRIRFKSRNFGRSLEDLGLCIKAIDSRNNARR